MAKLIKGSAAARAFMAKIRGAKTKKSVVGANKTLKYKNFNIEIVNLSNGKKEYFVKQISPANNREVNYGIYKTLLAAKKWINKTNVLLKKVVATKKVGAVKKAMPVKKATKKVGAVRKALPVKKANSMHKDTKSHNVNISVVSGTNDFNIERLKKATARLTELQRVYTNAKAVPLKDRNTFAKLMIKNIPKLIKNEKEFISMIKRNIK